jgi:hypothetical protein
MRRHTSAFVTAGPAAVLGILSVPDAISAQAEVDQRLPPYNPYPPGILPSDLDAEIASVQREVQFIFNEALNEWRALPRPPLVGNPPTLRGSGYEAVEILGKLLNFDHNMSPFGNEACGFCHMPYVAFSGPIPSVNLTMIAYPGTLHYRVGKTHRTAIAFASRAANDLVGWIAGVLSFYNATFYRHFYAWHHRYTQDPARDPELIYPPDRAGDRPSAASLNSGP